MYLYLYLKSKGVLIPLALTAAVSQADVETQIDSLIWILSSLSLGFETTTLKIWNEQMEDIMKIVKSLKKSVLMIKSVIEIIENKITEKRGGFFGRVTSYVRC